MLKIKVVDKKKSLLMKKTILFFEGFCNFFQFHIPVFAKFADKCIFDEFINGNLKFLAQRAGVIANMPVVIVYGRKFRIILNLDRI